FFSPDGRRALTHNGPFVRLWDVATGRQVKAFEPHPKAPVHQVAVSPDWRFLATAGEDGAIKLWELGGFKELKTLGGHETRVRCLAFSGDGKRLASSGGELVY